MSFTRLDAIYVVAVIAGIVVLMWAVRQLASVFAVAPEVQRKLVHVATGCVALTFPFIFSNPLPVFVLCIASIALMLVLRSPLLAATGLGGVLHGVERRSFGEIYLAFAIALIFVRSTGQPVLYVPPILVITLSDTASALVGTSYGRNRFAVADGSKSLEGVVAFFVVTWLCGMIALLLMTEAPRLNVILLSVIVAAFCALLEADSWRGLDNLYVPVGAHLLLARHLASAPIDLFSIAVLFVLALAAMLVSAPILRLSAHATRAYTVLLFLVISVTQPQNAILPILAIAGQIAARRFRPCLSERPDLDLLSATIAVALVWLLIGETVGHSVINLYDLTFAGAAVAFAALVLGGIWRALLPPFVVAVDALFVWIAGLNLPKQSMTPTLVVTAISIALCAAIPLLRPDWFQARRSAKVFAIALIVPAIVFASQGLP